MTYNYTTAQKLALKQIDDKGRTIVIPSVTDAGTFDPDTFTFVEGSTENNSVKGLFTNFRAQDVDGTTIKREDKRVLIAATSLDSAPTPSDVIIDGDVEYEIINCDTLMPGDVPILYMVQVRR